MPRKRWMLLFAVVIVLFLLRAADQDQEAVDDAQGSESPATSESATPEPVESGPEASEPVASEPEEPVERVSVGLLYNANPTGNFEIYRRRADGSTEQLTSDPAFDSWWVRPSPDGSRILFYRTPTGVHDTDYGQTSMWLANADGSGAVEALAQGAFGWDLHGHGEWSPDGTQLVMFGGARINPQVFITDAEGQNPRQVTNEGGSNLDPSWSPDGSTIAYVGCPNSICFEGDQEIYTVAAAGGERKRLTDDDLRDNDPYYSPDGSRIAFLTQTRGASLTAIAGYWDIRIVPSTGGESIVLTDGEAITSLPRWNQSGSAIFTHRLDYKAGSGFDLVSIDPDSGQVSFVLQTDADEEYPSP